MTRYEIAIVLKGGHLLAAEDKVTLDDARRWASDYSKQPGIDYVVITQVSRMTLVSYQNGEVLK